MTNYSKNLSQWQITRRWIWSRLCGFPDRSNPGNIILRDARSLYKRGQYYYGLKAYSIRRAAESLGVYPQKEIPYIREPSYTKPYMKGWRANEHSWASVRNPLWRGNRDNIGKGYCNWAFSAPEYYSWIEREELNKIVINNNKKWLETNPEPSEFHFERPELFRQGFTKDSVDYVIRQTFIEELVPRMKIDDYDNEGENLFELYDLEQIYGALCNTLKYYNRPVCSHEKFRIACYSYGIVAYSGEKGFRRTQGTTPFLDVVDQIKINILGALRAGSVHRPFDMEQLWEELSIDDVKEKMLYDAAVSELVYEGFIRVNSDRIRREIRRYSRNGELKEVEHGVRVELFDEEPTGREIELRLLYLHTLNSSQRKFKQQRPYYYGKYIGYNIWGDRK